MSAFKETYNMFRTHIGYTKPLSYDQWSSSDDQHKAAVLFVQFYEQITLAWYKVRSFYANEEDGVSTILQYLQKNVPVILDCPKRFAPSYIYKVAFNCLYCICHDIQRDKDRFENEVSDTVVVDEGEVICLSDNISLRRDKGVSMDSQISLNEFWSVVESTLLNEEGDVDSDAMAVLNKLLGGTAPVLTYYNADKSRSEFCPLAHIGKNREVIQDTFANKGRVKKDKREAVIQKIREALIQNGFEEYINIFDTAERDAEEFRFRDLAAMVADDFAKSIRNLGCRTFQDMVIKFNWTQKDILEEVSILLEELPIASRTSKVVSLKNDDILVRGNVRKEPVIYIGNDKMHFNSFMHLVFSFVA